MTFGASDVGGWSVRGAAGSGAERSRTGRDFRTCTCDGWWMAHPFGVCGGASEVSGLGRAGGRIGIVPMFDFRSAVARRIYLGAAAMPQRHDSAPRRLSNLLD